MNAVRVAFGGLEIGERLCVCSSCTDRGAGFLLFLYRWRCPCGAPPLFNVWVGVGPVGAIAAFELSEGAVRC